MKWAPKVGEVYTRMLAGTIATQVQVAYLDDELVYCCPAGLPMVWLKDECWTFDYEGKEVDPYMAQLMAKYGYPADAVVSFIKIPGVNYDVKELKPKEL